MRIGTGVLTSNHRVLCGEVSVVISSGELAARLAKRRRVFYRRRILSTSCRTNLGHRCMGSVPLFGAAGFCGNMAVAVVIVSPKTVWRSEAIERMAASTPWGFGGGTFCP